jgi:N-acyl-D-amino-acid deacylase
MRNVVILVFVVFTFGAYSQTQTKIQRIDSVLTALHQLQLFNGAVLIGDKGKVVYSKAFGISNPTSGEKLSTASAFNLASISKQFYTMMMMKLKEQGKVNYDDAVHRYLPEFPYPTITIRHLMNQTSGLPEYFEIADRHMILLDTLTNQMALELLATRKPPLVFEPGERWEYCNTNYTTLASIIEKLTGTTADQYVQQTIVRPLKLTNTYAYTLKMKSYPKSRVFGFRYEHGKPVLNDLMRFDGIMGDGNIYSSVEDLFKWDQALYTTKLVKKETFAEALTPGKLNSGEVHKYGFGWFIDEPGKVVSHTGGWVGFSNIIVRYIDTNQTLVVLTNGSNGTAARMVRELWEGKTTAFPKAQLIANVKIIDGTGLPAYAGSVRLVNNRITDIGNLSPLKGEVVTDGKGNVLAPGFIDSHSHHDGGLATDPSALAVINQGITTIVVGQDGGSSPMDSVSARLKAKPVSVNVASYTGHGTIRRQAMKGDVLRRATQDEIAEMKILLDAELEKGSLGLSTGLEYEVAFYAGRDEVIALAKVAAAKNGRYISHVRSEDVHLEEALNELLDIGREANIPVQISHLKIALRSKWGSSTKILTQLQWARHQGIQVTADVYPYTMWSSTPRVLFPDKDFENLSSAEFATKELFDPAASVMVRYPSNSSYVGKTVSEIASLNGESAAQALLRIIRDGSSSIVATSMSEVDVINFLRWEHTSICSDGSMGGHPRGHGSFTRVLGKYVREENIMPLEKAIYKMTGLAAENLGIKNRGLIAPGYFADLVLFNPDTVNDNATIDNPKALSSGIERLWVNGQVVYEEQRAVENYPGMLIRR